jgi:protein TonB
MITRDGRFLPSLALALAAHALLLFLLSRALGHQVFEARGVALEVQIASVGAAAAGPTPVSPLAPSPKPAVAPSPAPAAPPAPVPRKEVPPAEAPRPETSPPAAPAPSAVPPEDHAPAFPAVSNEAEAARAPAVPAGAPAAEGAGGGSGGSRKEGTMPSGGGSGSGFADAGGGTGAAAIEADIDPVLVRSIQVAYPSAARSLGQEGTVRVLVEIGTDGVVISDEVYSSSGHRMLDSAALDAVKKARFLPALKNGRPVVARILVPVRFRLDD